MVTIHPGKDGLVRAVKLKTAKGLITRPIQKLHDLEVFALASNLKPDMSSSCKQTPPVPVPCDSDTSTGTAKAHTKSKTDSDITTTRCGRTVKRVKNPDFVYDSD